MALAFLLEYAERQRQTNALRIERIRLRDRSDPLQLTEEEFVGHFRLTKAGFQQLFIELQPKLKVRCRRTAISNELKILAALLFYAQGSYQRNVGASFLLGMSQPTMSNCLHDVTDALNTPCILEKYIKFPMTQREREVIMRDFMDKFGFPGVIGCIDGTHVAIIRPVEHEENFFYRKNYHSLNVLIICDCFLNILHVDSSYPGAAHDSFVWNQSPVKPFVEDLERNGERCWFLGDSGYAQRNWMMTPILGAVSNSPEEFYTNLHCRVRNTVERCIGVLKARWRCLLAHRVLHYDPVTAARIVNACVVLHNIANAHNTPMPELLDSDIDEDQQHHLYPDIEWNEFIPDSTRQLLVQEFGLHIDNNLLLYHHEEYPQTDHTTQR